MELIQVELEQRALVRRRVRPRALLAAALLLFAACRSTEPERAPSDEPRASQGLQPQALAEVGDSIVVCGREVPIGAPVVLWSDPGGHDAYTGGAVRLGYRSGRTRAAGGRDKSVVSRDDTDPAALAPWVDQLVLHYDVCGASAVCFRVLHDRGLSVHFLLDIDGTIYQTLDVREEAWHATRANGRSVGVEIAQIGAYPPGDDTLDAWYPVDLAGPWILLPERFDGGGVRTRGFVGRPARPERITGEVNGSVLEQHDFTPEQYDSLVKLAAGLCRTLPGIAPDAPRDANGALRRGALSDEEFERFRGILGHDHVQANKFDPGPAFDWERFLADLRRELAWP